MDATINGLMEGISVLENNQTGIPAIESDILFNKEAEDLILPYDEFIPPSLDYYPYDYMETVSLLSTPNETFQITDNANDAL